MEKKGKISKVIPKEKYLYGLAAGGLWAIKIPQCNSMFTTCSSTYCWCFKRVARASEMVSWVKGLLTILWPEFNSQDPHAGNWLLQVVLLSLPLWTWTWTWEKERQRGREGETKRQRETKGETKRKRQKQTDIEKQWKREKEMTETKGEGEGKRDKMPIHWPSITSTLCVMIVFSQLVKHRIWMPIGCWTESSYPLLVSSVGCVKEKRHHSPEKAGCWEGSNDGFVAWICSSHHTVGNERF